MYKTVKTAVDVLKICTAVISLYTGLNDYEKYSVEQYAKMNANEWIEKQKKDFEVEMKIKNYITEIKE